MQPNHCDLLGQVREPRASRQLIRDGHPRDQNGVPGQPRPSGAPPMRSEDSWIEVSSQPSTSSLSSAAASDDIITTGLQVEHRDSGRQQYRSRRRRMQQLAAVTTAQVDYSSNPASSSQEEYEESESESDPPMSSSNEDIGPALRAPLPAPSQSDDGDSSDDEDDTSTALGMGISPSPFIPQPNVFSHPPNTSDPSWTRPSESRRSQPSVVSNSSRRTSIRRDSYPSIRPYRRSQQSQHSPYNMFSPSHHADHDAALRASLSTLLSCAAAARGLPKSDAQPMPSAPSAPAPTQPAAFRLVGESVAMGDESGEEDGSSTRDTDTSPLVCPPRRRHTRSPVATPGPPIAKAKRRSISPKDRSGSSRKGRRVSVAESTTPVSPTVMTWVISAGVVVLFSAISFSAGYMLGREVGRTEMGLMNDGTVPGARSSAACGQEAVRGGLKRFRWGTAAAGSASLA
ncbi:uncharacterized protein N7469_005658 [Penicillium citrinum]|uniref:Uncharacterized protein n=2 Tax=Penicillium TaxID=5073 RepID=A0A9W9P4C0_PENCI|nr:uncharacterized protein N7469_005658 [Penicillium citrinum]KAJ5233892.1 hypothetical protein N7469_005658 [Penicillium citrinum]KAJ5572639.1 hypothetical protein N7450_009623 [Penicillium hetheringtonii]KAK5790124.1 hypothetical protein VI817_007411 [Penicillium citrinum]